MMTASDIRELSVEELMKQEKELKEELFNLKFQKTLGQLEKTNQIREVRRNVARIKTIITQKNNVK